MDTQNNIQNKLDETAVRKIVGDEIDKSQAFSARRVIDRPTDAFAVVNRQFVTLNGVTASRPPSSILGQYYFDTTIGRPVWWNGSAWIKADGTAV